MTRIFCYVLAFYCVFLAVLPCHCMEQTEVESMRSEVVSHTESTAEHHRLDSLVCTPFCQCAGMHNPGFMPKVFSFFITPVQRITHWISNVESDGYRHGIRLFRPPKQFRICE